MNSSLLAHRQPAQLEKRMRDAGGGARRMQGGLRQTLSSTIASLARQPRRQMQVCNAYARSDAASIQHQNLYDW